MIQDRLLSWFDTHQRDLPWRRTRDPYAIWVSEIMLQQTQVKTVMPFFERWMQRFPTVGSLAAADEQDVLALWQGLGYYRRCRMLLQGARYVVAHGMPSTAAEWVKVPGVGRYTAGAIASIAFAEATPLVDGNVERVYARLVASRSRGPSLMKEAWAWAASSVPEERPGGWNQALMELGAMVCKPVEPLCSSCPLAASCSAFAQGLQDEIPVAVERPRVVRLAHEVVVPLCGSLFGVSQVPEGQWWHGMWGFPRRDLADAPFGFDWLQDVGQFRHSVTNHRIVVDVRLARVSSCDSEFRWCDVGELAALPMPAPQRRALRMVREFLGDA